MASRSKSSHRRDRDSDAADAIKPLIVLGLLGTILYGAYSVVQKGPATQPPEWQTPTASQAMAEGGLDDAPPFGAGPAGPPIVAPPAVEVSAPPAAGPVAFAPNPVSGQPAGLQAAGSAGMTAAPRQPPAAAIPQPDLPLQPPTILNAQSAPPPVADPPAALGATAAPLADPVAAPGLEHGLAAAPSATPAGLSATPVGPPAATASAEGVPATAAFATSWAEAHDKLAAGRFAEALATLSTWQDDPSLGLEESQRLDDLLSQLAGSVIYSQQDLLLPPHIVAPGDTLQSIAAQLGVPWQLLAKINGVDDPERLIPGEHLKVLRGPFDAVVSVSRRRLSLQVGGNYAGSFPVVIGRQIQERVGSSLAVVDVRRGDAPSSAPAAATQVSFVGSSGSRSIVLGDGISIEPAEDPAAVADAAPAASLVVAARDLDEIIDILGPGSHVLVRK